MSVSAFHLYIEPTEDGKHIACCTSPDGETFRSAPRDTLPEATEDIFGMARSMIAQLQQRGLTGRVVINGKEVVQ